ncbi:MAG: M48 family metallopeptidase [Candidatus Sulfotelmatobacter sp.]
MKATAWLFLCLAIGTLGAAQPAPAAEAATTAQLQAQQLQPNEPPQELKVTEYSLPPDKLAKAEALYKTRTMLYLFGTVFGIVVLGLLLKLRVAPAFRDLAERVSQNSFLQALVFVPLLTLSIAIISLPIDIYEQHTSRAYGLSVQGWLSWAGDWCKAEGVLLVILVPMVFGLFRVIRKSPQRWWFYFWLLTLPFLVLLIFVTPVILDPMFNTFEPLEKKQPLLVSEIEKVTRRGGLSIPRDRMFEMEASEKVTTYNAYVTGIGVTKRVVVWDNTSRDLTVPETLFVFGHEMGHYVLNHVYKGLAFFSAMMLAGLWLGRRIVLALLARWGEAWHIRGINDLAALPVLMLALSLLTLVSEPIGNTFSRYLEHQADIYGLEVTHGLFPNNGEVAASSLQKLGEKSYDYPTPNRVLVFWSYDHPSIPDRIRFCLHYDPWHMPKGPTYVK